MPTESYDLIVIGSGPAGEKGAAQAAYFGKKVALIEKAPYLGGAAANTGTLPSKTLRETALFLSNFRQRQLYGLDISMKEKVTVPDFLAREHQVKDRERARIVENLKRHRVKQYVGAASFVDANTVAIKPDRCPEFHIQGDKVLIATGSYPVRPPSFQFYDPRVYDSDTILSLREIPPTMLAVGGGVVGCEYACMFAALGVQVTLVEKRDRLISSLDAEIVDSLTKQMQARGVKILFNDSERSIEPGDLLGVELESDTHLKVHTILVSAGRCGNVETLGLDKLGIATNPRGQIKVNKSFQTSLPHVYAAGDVIGNPSLASTSMEQARLAMVHAFDLKYREQAAPVLPYGIYTIPECSMVGETEQSLTQKHIPYIVGKSQYVQNA